MKSQDNLSQRCHLFHVLVTGIYSKNINKIYTYIIKHGTTMFEQLV